MTRPVKDSVVSDDRNLPSTSASWTRSPSIVAAEVDDVAGARERRAGLVAQQLLRLARRVRRRQRVEVQIDDAACVGMRPLLHQAADDGTRRDRAVAGLDLDVEALVVAHREPADAGRGIHPHRDRGS